MVDVNPTYPPGWGGVSKSQVDRALFLLPVWSTSLNRFVTRPAGDLFGYTATVNHTTANVTLTGSAEGKLHTNIGSAVNVILTLYAVTGSNIGDELLFYRSAASAAPYWLQLVPSGTDKIGRFGAGKYVRMMDPGTYLWLRAVEAGVWGIVAGGPYLGEL